MTIDNRQLSLPTTLLSFRRCGPRRLYEDDDHRGFYAEHVAKIRVILARLDVAREAEAMNLPGLRLHAL